MGVITDLDHVFNNLRIRHHRMSVRLTDPDCDDDYDDWEDEIYED